MTAVFVLIFVFLLILFVLVTLYFKRRLFLLNKKLNDERAESSRRIYELAILKELGERVGYSLNIEEILTIITGSLKQFIDYSAVSYIVLNPEKIKLNIHLESSVNKSFTDDLKKRMLASLAALTERSFENSNIDEVISGAIEVESMQQNIGSYFNIPIVIGGNLAGILTVAHVQSGLYAQEDMTILYKIVAQASEAVNRLQEVVRLEQGKLNAMVESMGDGVIMVDGEYRLIVVNPAIKKLLGFAEDAQTTIFDLIDSLSGKFDVRGRMEEAMIKNTTYVSPRVQIKDIFFEIGVYPVTDHYGKSERKLGAVAVFHDISRDIELEMVREEFTSMIVHELRSPLDGIRKIIELFLSGKIKKTSKEFKEYLNMVFQSSSSMLELVNDILDLSKLQAGKFEVRKEPSNLREVLENRVTFYKVSAEAKNISLDFEVAKNVPEIIDFDPQAVKQILNNFISNALKFTSANGSIHIGALVLEDKNMVQVSVVDSGIGIEPEALKTLFQTYKQAKISSLGEGAESVRSTGLGLVIAKGIAESHGGAVGAVSTPGKGSSFYFTIPIKALK